MKIGIFGGTFNPIHIGHAIIANYISQHSDLDAIWLMVAPQNPLKNENLGATDQDRIKMVELVSSHLDNTEVSTFEFNLPKPSFTYKTLQELSAKFPNDEFALIIGADNWSNFNKWKNYADIINNFHIYVYPRHGYNIIIPDDITTQITAVNAPLIEISSTEIREGLKNLCNMQFFLPDEVYKYILENKLYLNV